MGVEVWSGDGFAGTCGVRYQYLLLRYLRYLHYLRLHSSSKSATW